VAEPDTQEAVQLAVDRHNRPQARCADQHPVSGDAGLKVEPQRWPIRIRNSESDSISGEGTTPYSRHGAAVPGPHPCGGEPIDYDGPTFWVVNGNPQLNPRALVIGHVVSRYEAKRLGWTAAMINDISNTRGVLPEAAGRGQQRQGSGDRSDAGADEP
jgi:hypothetical protein